MAQRENTETAEQQADGGIANNQTEQAYSGRGTNRGLINVSSNPQWLISERVDMYGPPIAALVSTILAWVVVDTPFFTVEMTGVEVVFGKATLGVALISLVSVVKRGQLAGFVRYLCGSLIFSCALLQIPWNSRAETRFMRAASTAPDAISESVSISLSVETGIGVWLALASGVAIVVVEYRRQKYSE